MVGDTDTSLPFYRGTLGLRVAGESANYGPEQERLNSVFGARLRITGLKAAKGPGIEFLEYLAPRNGRQAAGIQPNDLAHWETTVTTADENLALERFVKQRVMLVSPSVALLGRPLEFAKGLLVQDPDSKLVSVEFQDADGKKIRNNSRMSSGEKSAQTQIYDFNSKPPEKLVLQILTPKSLVAVPLELKDLPLP